jgi:PAS domain S-box-containing protein
VYGVMNTAADVSALNLAQQQLQKSEANLRQIILQAPVAMCILLGPSHTVEVANEFMIRLWGKNRRDVMHKPIFDGLPDAREQGLEALLDQVYNRGKPVRATERPVMLLRQGRQETVYVNLVYEPYRDSEGTILGVLAICIDVTEQVLARQQIEEVVTERTHELAVANEQLQKSNAELAQFAYIASHDLQEPLRKISTYSELLDAALEGRLDEKSARYLQKIKDASLRMHALIRDVLTYSQLLKETEIFTLVDLNKIIAEILTDHELMIEQKQAVVRIGQLPAIEAIPLQMSQLFGNLIGNALKFARRDQPPVITVSGLPMSVQEKEALLLDPAKEYYRLRFEDNGIGFKAEYAEKIFDIFQRLHNNSEYAGTGIGLAMCKKIALNHGGNIDALQSSEEGAVFTVILPSVQR